MGRIISAFFGCLGLNHLGTARNPDLCAGYDLPVAFGETDGWNTYGCFVSLNSGYFVSTNTYSTLLSGNNYGTPNFINLDVNMAETTNMLLVPTGSSDFNDVDACTSDANNNKVAFLTDGDHYVGFY